MAKEVGHIYVRLSAKTGQFAKGISGAMRKLDKMGISVQKVTRRTAILAGVIGGAGFGLVKSFISAADEAEGYRLRLNSLLRDTEEANKVFKEMAEYAARVPFEYRKIMESATRLSGVLEGGREEIARYMPVIADIAAATGMQIEDVTSNVIRMYSGGIAAARQFRLRGVTAMMGFKSGVTYSVEESRRMFLESWDAIDSKFRGVTAELAKTWTGLMSMFSDRWFQFRNMVSDAGLFDVAKAAAKKFLDWITEQAETGALAEFAKKISDAVLAAVRGFGNLMRLIGGLIAEVEKDPLLLKEGLLGYILMGVKGAAIFPWLGRQMDSFFRIFFTQGVSAAERIKKDIDALVRRINTFGDFESEERRKLVAELNQLWRDYDFLTESEKRLEKQTFTLSSVFFGLADAIEEALTATREAGREITNLVNQFDAFEVMGDEIPDYIDMSIYALEQFEQVIDGLSYAIVASLDRSAVTFKNFGKTVIAVFRNIMLSNWVTKFLKEMGRIALVSGPAGGAFTGFARILSKVLGFQQGTAGPWGAPPGPSDVVPALVSPGERITPAGQPTSLAQPVAGGGTVVENITYAPMIDSPGQRRHFVEYLESLGVVVRGN